MTFAASSRSFLSLIEALILLQMLARFFVLSTHLVFCLAGQKLRFQIMPLSFPTVFYCYVSFWSWLLLNSLKRFCSAAGQLY